MHLASLTAPGGASTWPLYSVVAHAGRFGVVLAKRPDAAVVALVQRQHEPQHRSDVRVDEISDLIAMALPGGSYLIRTAKTLRWPQGVVVGACTPSVKRDIVQAMRREAEAAKLEDKYRHSEVRTQTFGGVLGNGSRRVAPHIGG
jgi:hypothetical protein